VIAFDCGLISLCVRVLKVAGAGSAACLNLPPEKRNGKRGNKVYR